MKSDGMMDDMEFEKAIDEFDPNKLLIVTARQVRNNSKDMESLRTEIVDAFKNLPCRSSECTDNQTGNIRPNKFNVILKQKGKDVATIGPASVLVYLAIKAIAAHFGLDIF
jgi:hypothetical protein